VDHATVQDANPGQKILLGNLSRLLDHNKGNILGAEKTTDLYILGDGFNPFENLQSNWIMPLPGGKYMCIYIWFETTT